MAKRDELQRHTLRVLAELGAPGKPLSARAAGERLEIGYNQIADMVKGKAPAEKTLIKFASAAGEEPADWLRYAGKYDFAKTLGASDAGRTPEEDGIARQIARDLLAVPPELRPLLIRQVRAVIQSARQELDK